MQLHATAMTGPEFLHAVAQQNEAEGLSVNAQAFAERAMQWARDQQTIQHLREENDALSTRMAEAQRVMRGV